MSEISLLKDFKCKFDRYVYKTEQNGEQICVQEIFIESNEDSLRNFNAYLHNMNVFSNANGIFHTKVEEMEKAIEVSQLLSYFERNWNNNPQAFIFGKAVKKFAYATGFGGETWSFEPIVKQKKEETVVESEVLPKEEDKVSVETSVTVEVPDVPEEVVADIVVPEKKKTTKKKKTSKKTETEK